MGFTVSSSGVGVNTLTVPGGWSILYDSGVGITEAIPGEQGPMATVRFKVYDANQRYSFVNQLLGKWTGTVGGGIVYVGPYLYPPSPNLFCTSVVSIESLGKWLPMSGVALPWLFGKSAIVTAVFSRPPWQPATTGGYFTIQYTPTGEFLKLPETTYQFPDGTPTDTPVGLFIPMQDISVNRYRMPYIPDTTSVTLQGRLNNAPFTIGAYSYPQGTLIYNGMATEVAPDPLGNITYNVQYKFSYRYIDWNYLFHPNRTSGFQLVTDGNGNPPYQYTSFEVLP